MAPMGRCVLCGTWTENRCSDCLKHGTDYLYFCSVEHKKVVYPVHKLVCGVRSNPFQWPGFGRFGDEWRVHDDARQLEKEIDDLQGISKYLDDLRDAPKGQRLSDEAAQKVIAGRLDNFQTYLTNFAKSSPSWPAEEVVRWCCLKVDLLGSAIYRQESKIRSLPSDPKTLGQHWSKFQHLFLIAHYIHLQYVSTCGLDNKPPCEFLADYMRWTQTALIRFRKETIAKTHPAEAAMLRDVTGVDEDNIV